VLKGETRVELREEPAKAARPDRPAPAALVAADDEALLGALKAVRRRLAEAQGVPAYVVFPDRTLIEFATLKPQDLDALARCHGVGAKKLARYGPAFLEALTGSPPPAAHPARVRLAGTRGALFDALMEAHRDLAPGGGGLGKPLSCTQTTLAKIVEARPRDLEALARIPGVGPEKAERFGAAFLAAIRAAEG
jgi:ATP-dependent DNA helicase RecQ